MIVPLNIVMTYPVYWNRYSVLRDFIQNFYDSTDREHFADVFEYQYDDKKQLLKMWIDGITFNYEWLLHIGASTKTSNSADNAGYFGEGFKIASLCAIRDFGWDIEMFSGEWKLKVIQLEQAIDSKELFMLAYDVRKKKEKNRSMLVLQGIGKQEFCLFESVIKSFFYPKNPLLGEKIWEGNIGAIYKRSRTPYDENLPYTRDYGKKGLVFCGYQLLGSSPFDLVVCLHRYKKEDRERKSLYDFQVVDVFEKLVYYVDAEGAMYMLEKMRRYWNSTPSKKIDIHSWYPVIKGLIRKVSESADVRHCFVQKYPDLLYLAPIHSVEERNKRGQARAWLSQQDGKYIVVQHGFIKLGYESLENVCQKNGGFVRDDLASGVENESFVLLEELVAELYDGFFVFMKQMPSRRIICNTRAVYHGMATVFKCKGHLENDQGIVVRYDVGTVYLKKSIFSREGFYDALSTYIHELCHMFGGDASQNFSLGLTMAMEILLSNSESVNCYRDKWRELY